MKGTDTFHLGDEYYVYVNWEATIDLVSVAGETLEWARYFLMWVGESYGNCVRCDLTPIHAYSYECVTDPTDALRVVNGAKVNEVRENMIELILKYKNELELLITEQ